MYALASNSLPAQILPRFSLLTRKDKARSQSHSGKETVLRGWVKQGHLLHPALDSDTNKTNFLSQERDDPKKELSRFPGEMNNNRGSLETEV